MSDWKPSVEEAEFLGRALAIDAGVAKQCRDLLAKGWSLNSVRGTLDDALKIAAMVQRP